MTLITSTDVTLSPLERAVVEAVAYSDVFAYPLTAEEVWRALTVAATLEEVQAALESENLARYLTHVAPYYTLVGHENSVAVRERRYIASRTLIERAQTYGRLIARLPFVRMIAVTGSLAVENAEPGDDLDYLIVTAPGRVWLARTFVMAIVRLASLRGDTVCPNYLLAEGALALADHDLYTARELVQMLPVTGARTRDRLLAANPWWPDYLPNATPRPADGIATTSGNRPLEALLGGRIGDAIERFVFRRKARELRMQSSSAEAVFDETTCKGHFEGHGGRTREALARRLSDLGLAP